MTLWICIPVFNRIQYTINFLNSFRQQAYRDFKVVICDHGSTDGTSELIKRDFPEVILIEASQDLWWTGAINLCVSYVLNHADDADKIVTLNNDTELPVDYLEKLTINAAKYPQAILTSVIYNIESKQLHSAGYKQDWWLAKERPVDFERDHLPDNTDIIMTTHASGRGTLFPVSAFKKLGLYDEIHLPHYAADYDFTHKARRHGYPIYICKNCIVYSYVDATGLTKVRHSFTWKSLKDYLFSIRSPANLQVRWRYGINNCPKLIFPLYMMIDYIRVFGSFFKFYLFKTS